MDINTLLARNPWWKGRQHFEEDEDYKKWEEKKIKWLPKILRDITTKPFSLHFIFGPRQVGKTTIIKLKIKELLENCKPEEVFYFRCEELKDYKELDEVLIEYYRFKEEKGMLSSYIFLDEISFADEWYRTIKSWIDDGRFKNDVVIISGSASLEVKKHAEYFPGRRGNGSDFFVLPLCFREFIEILNPGLKEKLPILNSLEKEEIVSKSKETFFYFKELDSLFRIYLKIGGFPLAINSYSAGKEINQETRDAYLSWIKNDIVKLNRDINIAREIIKSMIAKIPTPISWGIISKETSIKSPKTVNTYLHMFKELFLINISNYINPNNLTAEFGKNKKIHLNDPLFYELFEMWCLSEIKEKENKKAEDIVASHLYRFGKKQKKYYEEVFYWKNGFEVDSVIRTKDKAIGFEVKFGEKAKPIEKVVGKMKDIYLISKRDYDIKKRVIPIAVFLAMIRG